MLKLNELLRNLVAFLLLTLISVCNVNGQETKRGLAYGYLSPQDLEVLSPETSWWYNWSVTPESSVASVFEEYGFEFVPMVWNGSYNESQLRAYLTNHPETKYILAFNEPNFIEQAKMTPSQVAAQWPRLEAIADDFDLEIVAPAVNYCGNCVTENGTTYTNPWKYLDDFFAACPDCRVDHIAVHSYMNTVSALEWFIGEFKKYGKPIWLTEFAGWEENGNITSVDDQINYMIGAVNYLESDPDVFRYAWFIGRSGGGITKYPYIDILGANGQLTALGEVYTQMPVHNENQIVQIPAVIEAEEYNKMSGIQMELTADSSGFANIGYIDTGDWLEYKINVPETGSYNIQFRIASTQRARLFVLLNGETILNQPFDNTSGWQNWETYVNTIELPAGEQTIRLQAGTSGFNINWFQIGDISTSIANFKNSPAVFTVYPNPGNGEFKIRTSEKIKELVITAITGNTVHSLSFSNSVNLSFLAPGIYSLRAIGFNGEEVANKKIMIR